MHPALFKVLRIAKGAHAVHLTGLYWAIPALQHLANSRRTVFCALEWLLLIMLLFFLLSLWKTGP